MPKKIDVPELPKKRETPANVQDYLDNVRNKSIRQIIKEGVEKGEESEKPPEEPSKEEAEAKGEAEAPKEETQHKEEQPSEEKVDIAEVAKTAAREAAQESTKELKEEIARIKESDKTEKEKKEEIRELKANWTGFDKESGAPTPKDYDEIVKESVRLAKEEALRIYREQKQAEIEQIQKTQEEDKKAYDANLIAINQRINAELEELYANKKLIRPKDPNDLTDPAARKVKDLFDQAAAENVKRQAAGQPLIDSIVKYFFMYYQPKEEKQPAGEEAPIAGAKTEAPETEGKLDYFKDIHNPSFKQILYGAARKLRGK